MEPAFCEKTRKIVINAAQSKGLRVIEKGTCITIEGPRFSSRAESQLYRTWGADVINMTTVPEVCLQNYVTEIVSSYSNFPSIGHVANKGNLVLVSSLRMSVDLYWRLAPSQHPGMCYFYCSTTSPYFRGVINVDKIIEL